MNKLTKEDKIKIIIKNMKIMIALFAIKVSNTGVLVFKSDFNIV